MTTKVFKTEEERLKAYDDIPEVKPENQTQEEFEAWQANEFAEIEAAEINAEHVSEKPPEEKPGETLEKPPEEKPAEIPQNNETEILNNRIRLKEEEFQAQQKRIKEEYEAKFKKQNEEWKKRFDEINKKPDEPEVDPDIKILESEVKRSASELDAADPLNDEEYSKKLRTQQNLQWKLQQKKDAYRDIQLKKIQEEKDRLKEELNSVKTERSAAEEQRLKQIEQERIENLEIQEIESFRSRHPEFKSDKSYKDIKSDYINFGVKIGALYWGKPESEVTSIEIDNAITAYIDKSPALLDKAAKYGYKEPDSFQQFVALSEVNTLKKGYRNVNGRWEKYTDGMGNKVNFPDLDAAYDKLNVLNGKKGEELFEAQQAGADSVTAALNKRSDPAEMDLPHQPGKIDTGVTYEQAIELLDKRDANDDLIFDEMKMARLRGTNPESPLLKEYDKLIAVLDQ